MFQWLNRLLHPPISAADFERAVFASVSRRITDTAAVSKELEAAWNLASFEGGGAERGKEIAHHYLALEEHIANGQSTGRIPREKLRDHIVRHYHPERAEGVFALLFLTSYLRQIRLYERFTATVFERVRTLVPRESYEEVLTTFANTGELRAVVKNGVFHWEVFEANIAPVSSADQVVLARNILSNVIDLLVKCLFEALGTVRAELILQEVYHQFQANLDFLDDVSSMLLLVPEDLLGDERIGLMQKPELEHELQRKSQEFEMTVGSLRAEKEKLSTLSREELERKVEERTAELVKALEEVKASRASLEEFTSLATHELRTPAGIIKGYAELLLEGGTGGTLTEGQERFVVQIKDAIERQLGLVNAMLNASRIELGTLAIEPQPVHLPDIAEKVIGEMMIQFEGKHLRLEKQYDDKLPIFNIDPKLTHAILQNLLSNAIKYTPDGGAVTLSIEKRGSDAVISVVDTGYGIPTEQQPKMFSKLFRGDNVRTLQIEGTGLGLYIVKSVLEQSGGKIWFESPSKSGSAENPGTAFYVSIPLAGMRKKQGMRGLT